MRLRRFILPVLAIAALLAMHERPAEATCHGFGSSPQPFAYESITVSSASIGFTSATYAPAGQTAASVALVTTETNPIRFRSDGTAPTSSEGHLAAASSQIEVCGAAAVANFRMIRTGSDATAKVTFFRN